TRASGAARRRRFVVRFILLSVSGLWPWVAVALLGAYHGIDPSMGWLFAVALGLQERRRAKVISALPPIAAGHLVSVGIVVALIAWAIDAQWWVLRPLGAIALIAFGLFRFVWPRAHPRWVAMRVNARDLAIWSFLMATAHGAGLMLFPILMDMQMPAMAHHHMMHPMPATGGGALGFAQALAVVAVHTGAMLLVMGAVALIIYEWVGLKILRSAWINLDAIWAGALVAAGALSLVI
ncbi:MAG TPA: hypothetical protein VJ718_06565, partial [Candidatus Binataceae bacterium]|nr:hypothetical protein [Candidatus Binataceae bacterium]